jgi:hypothetical protein
MMTIIEERKKKRAGDVDLEKKRTVEKKMPPTLWLEKIISIFGGPNPVHRNIYIPLRGRFGSQTKSKTTITSCVVGITSMFDDDVIDFDFGYTT